MTDKERDAFFTNKNIAAECLKDLKRHISNFTQYKFLEPSAGSGVFIKQLLKIGISKNKIFAVDIEPQSDLVLQSNFLFQEINTKIQSFSSPQKLLIVGNPPFGKRSKTAIQFLEKSFLFADTVAFILPNQFTKWSIQSKLQNNLKLIYQKALPPKSFTFKNKPYGVNCHFQIWTRKKTPDKDLRIRSAPKIKHIDFDIFQYNNTPQAKKYFNKSIYKWSFAVPRQGFYDYSIRIQDPSKLNPKIQYAFFKSDSQVVIARLNSIDFGVLAKNNTSILGFGKHDVISYYTKKWGDTMAIS